MNLVGKRAPKIKAAAVINGEELVEKFSLDQYFGKKNIILFFYPKDFSSVCLAENHAFQEKLEEFEKRDAIVIGCSTDTEETHLAWLNTPRENGGIHGVTFPIIADTSKVIALNYGVLGGEYSFDDEKKLWSFNGAPVALRGTFLIDKDGIVRHQSINDFPLVRNADEYLRLLDAQAHFEKYAEVCPADKEESEEAMVESKEGVKEYFSTN